MMILKAGVQINGIHPELVLGLYITHGIYEEYFNGMVVTSIMEGRHSHTSLHYVGYAFDIRMSMFVDEEHATLFAERLCRCLTNEFDVVLEWGDGSHPHLHVEFQPKRPD